MAEDFKTRRDCQVREVDGGFVIVLVTRNVNAEGKTIDNDQAEHVASSGMICAEILKSHFDPKAAKGGEG